MTETPILNNPEILQRLRDRFPILGDYPTEIRGERIDEASYLGTLETDDFFGFCVGYSPTKETVKADHFNLLSKEENLQLAYYRILKPVDIRTGGEMRVQLSGREPGTVTGINQIPVYLDSCGLVQLRWGKDIAVLWEAFFDPKFTQRLDHEVLMNQLWSRCEEFLYGQGVSRIYTYNRDLRFTDQWYRAFLERRGYQPVTGRNVTVMKKIGNQVCDRNSS